MNAVRNVDPLGSETGKSDGVVSLRTCTAHGCLDVGQPKGKKQISPIARKTWSRRSGTIRWLRPQGLREAYLPSPMRCSLIRLVLPVRPIGCPATNTTLSPGIRRPELTRICSIWSNI